MKTVQIVIVLDETGDLTVDITGPIKGKAGMLTLLDEARSLVEQMEQ